MRIEQPLLQRPRPRVSVLSGLYQRARHAVGQVHHLIGVVVRLGLVHARQRVRHWLGEHGDYADQKQQHRQGAGIADVFPRAKESRDGIKCLVGNEKARHDDDNGEEHTVPYVAQLVVPDLMTSNRFHLIQGGFVECDV